VLPVVVKDGRFGAYVTDSETNATLRKGDEVETIAPPERAYELLAEKRARGPAPPSGSRPNRRLRRRRRRRSGRPRSADRPVGARPSGITYLEIASAPATCRRWPMGNIDEALTLPLDLA
jgi:DNA topoisomerase-1